MYDNETFLKVFNKIKNLDRRVVFVLIAIAVIIPLLKPMNLKVVTSAPVEKAYDAIEKLPENGTVIISSDYDPSVLTEIGPMHKAILHHLFRRNIKVIGMALWPQGYSLGGDFMDEIGPQYGKKYGEDFVNIGYKPGTLVVINTMAKSIGKIFKADVKNTPLEKIPMMRSIRSLSDIDLVISFAAGAGGVDTWVLVANTQYNIPVVGGCTAVQAPQFYPLLNTGQLTGLLGGLKGAAEYEVLVGKPGLGIAGMDAQSVTHLVIILFIIIGNLTYYIDNKLEERKKHHL